MLSRCFLDFSVGVGAFVIELSQISSFSLTLSSHMCFSEYCFTLTSPYQLTRFYGFAVSESKATSKTMKYLLKLLRITKYKISD